MAKKKRFVTPYDWILLVILVLLIIYIVTKVGVF